MRLISFLAREQRGVFSEGKNRCEAPHAARAGRRTVQAMGIHRLLSFVKRKCVRIFRTQHGSAPVGAACKVAC